MNEGLGLDWIGLFASWQDAGYGSLEGGIWGKLSSWRMHALPCLIRKEGVGERVLFLSSSQVEESIDDHKIADSQTRKSPSHDCDPDVNGYGSSTRIPKTHPLTSPHRRKHKPYFQPHIHKRVHRQLKAPLIHNIPLQLRTLDQDPPFDPTILPHHLLQQLKG